MIESCLTRFPLAFVFLLASSKVFASDPQAGRALHEQNCFKCHDTGVYTRPDRRVTSLPGLHKQVRFCEQQLELRWFEEDVKNVAEYLNDEFYKFPK